MNRDIRKTELFKKYASTAFHLSDDGWEVRGKYGRLNCMEDGLFDAWFIGPNLKPLSGRRLKSIQRHLSRYGTFHLLTGEAWIQNYTLDFVVSAAALMGIRRKSSRTVYPWSGPGKAHPTVPEPIKSALPGAI